jgi:type I restriction enzyme M protein
LIARDKSGLVVFWLEDKSLTDLENLPEPDELAKEIIENLEASLNSLGEVLVGLDKASCDFSLEPPNTSESMKSPS